MKHRIAVALFALVPVQAFAQGEVSPTLDPGTSGIQGPAPTPPPAPAPAPTAAKPNVVVVDQNGKIVDQTAPEAAESGYYISGDQGPTTTTEPVEVHQGPAPELHVVRRGDTLWDISAYYFNNPWEWPKVWSYNPQITNPHWIYPGDLVRLLPRGMFATEATPAEPEATPATSTDQTLPAPARKLEVGVKQTAFVEKSDLDKSVTVDGSVDEKELLGEGDNVYLSYPDGKPPKVGERYTIYRPGKSVKGGYGAYVQVLGTLEVVSVKQDKRARGVIVQANQEIERGDKVGPLMKSFQNVPPVAPKVDAQGPIVGLLTRDQLIGDGEVVFVALGKNSGVEVGNRMFVVRRGDALPPRMSRETGQDDRRFPARALGEVVIVEVGDNVSIGLVTLAVQEMGVGDLVMMQKAAQ